MVISLYLRGYLSDFDEIWYTDANFDSEDGHVSENCRHTFTFHPIVVVAVVAALTGQ